nr:helix-turn-helix domain-containing protein [uncultured Pseudodesulfovibrio sp.]
MKHDILGLKELIRLNVRTYADMSSITDLGELRSAFLKATEMVFDDLEDELKTFGASSSPKKSYSIEGKKEKHPKAYEKWTPEEEKELAQRYEQGIPIPEIAEQLGRNPGGIRSRLQKLGLC